VDAVILAGDIYDKSVPAAEAMSAFDTFVCSLADKGIRVFMISGNHDSSERISYFSGIISRAGINTSSAFNGKLQTMKVSDEYGSISIHMMPFIRPLQVKKFYPDEEIVTYEDAVKTVIANSDINKEERNILIAHQFIVGAEISDSEEFAVGGLDAISGSVFDDFDYVALGHLHKPQKVRRETMRYAGSPLKYSLSEVNHRKSVTIINMEEKSSEIQVSQTPLEALHDVREVRGMLEEVMSMEYSEDYVGVILTDEMVPPDARVTVSAVFPNMIAMGVENSRTGEAGEIFADGNIEDKSRMDLFADFYRLLNGNTDPDEKQIKIMEEVLGELEEESYEAD
jgi:exonuclease SbcD